MFLGSSLFLAQPWGLLALLGVPITLAIFLIQQSSKERRISTLFLLREVAPEDLRGSKIDYIRNSASLWLTLLSVLFVSLFLTDLRIIRSDSAQRVAFVLDSTFSMHPFAHKARLAVAKKVAQLARLARHTEWILVDSDDRIGVLYEGRDREQLIKMLDTWQPHRATHSFATQLALATSLVQGGGSTILVSDRQQELPPEVSLLAVGEPFENVGFVGFRVADGGAQNHFEVLVKNYGSTAQDRTYAINGGASQGIHFEAGQLSRLEIDLPGDALQPPGTISVDLSRDGFTLDDTIELLQSVPRRLRVSIDSRSDLFAFFRRAVAAVANTSVEAPGESSDLSLGSTLSDSEPGPSRAIVVPPARAESNTVSREPVVASPHPLTAGLVFDGMNLPPARPYSVREGDLVLVWQGVTPLIVLQPRDRLLLNFDPTSGAASQHAGLVVLLARFLDRVRAEVLREERRSFDLNEWIALPEEALGGVTMTTHLALSKATERHRLDASAARSVRAPGSPATFDISAPSGVLVTGVSNFVDTQEGSFAECSSIDPLAEITRDQLVRSSTPDPLSQLWLILAGLAIVLAWHFDRRTYRPISLSSPSRTRL